MNRRDFVGLVEALKRRSPKIITSKPTKPKNFDRVWNRKVVDVGPTKMQHYLHAIKVGWHSTMELAQSYLKGYCLTWWKTIRQEEGKTHGYTWEFFKECIKLKFIPMNSDHISRCKLHDLVNLMNDHLCQYVKAYTKFMLEIWHMHEFDWVCHFVMSS
jgi:hypothetical protein